MHVFNGVLLVFFSSFFLSFSLSLCVLLGVHFAWFAFSLFVACVYMYHHVFFSRSLLIILFRLAAFVRLPYMQHSSNRHLSFALLTFMIAHSSRQCHSARIKPNFPPNFQHSETLLMFFAIMSTRSGLTNGKIKMIEIDLNGSYMELLLDIDSLASKTLYCGIILECVCAAFSICSRWRPL